MLRRMGLRTSPTKRTTSTWRRKWRWLSTMCHGRGADAALEHIKLIMLANDVSLRAYGRREMQSGFGFLQAKPSTVFSPLAVTPDELGRAWQRGRLHRSVTVRVNGRWVGSPNAAHMTFSFGELIAHAARTRRLSAGTIVGSGTVSDPDRTAGSATSWSCGPSKGSHTATCGHPF